MDIGPRLHVAYREERTSSLSTSMALEPVYDATITNYATPGSPREYKELSSLDVGDRDGSVAVLHFEGVPSGIEQARLVLSKAGDDSVSNSSCAREYVLTAVSNVLSNGAWVSTAEEPDGRYAVAVQHVRRLAVLDVTDIVNRHVEGGRIGLLLSVSNPKCGSWFRSSRYIPDSEYGKINVRFSERPRLELQYAQDCGECFFSLTSDSVLTGSGGRNCSCTSLGFSKQAIHDVAAGALDGLDALESLDLSGNNLAVVRLGIFHANLTSLRELDLSDNLISSIEAGAISMLVNLEKLWLQRNDFAVLPRRFLGLENLRVLSLARNPAAYVELGAFDGVEELTWLDLSHNQHETIDTDVWISMGKLEAISMAGNTALQCIPVRPRAPWTSRDACHLAHNACLLGM
eukprot:3936838-Rhodomonas_salina.5